ncbi:MAG TPA: dephospho-CoA kinase [Longimicrobiaceae bacterium]|nr:dephospho-CoA kinase [Longimicrobiaceae bacterium]
MLRVGLTGNIASGKSAVARVWRELGATVVDADELARRAVEPGTPALRRIAGRWGGAVLDEAGRLDRGALREIVFRDGDARRELEAIVHPEVAALRDEAFRAAAVRGERVVVAEIPLLFEAGLAGDFDVIVLVDAPEAARRERIVRDRGLAPDDAERMIRAQMPAEQKRARADYVIENAGSEEALRAGAARVWRLLRERAGGGR